MLQREMEIEHSLKYASVNKTSDILKLSLQHLRFWNLKKKCEKFIKIYLVCLRVAWQAPKHVKLKFVWVFFIQSFYIFFWMLWQCNRFSNIVFTWQKNQFVNLFEGKMWSFSSSIQNQHTHYSVDRFLNARSVCIPQFERCS